MATRVVRTDADAWERDALALVGRSVQLVLPNPNDSGIVLAAILRHHYLHEPLQECIDDCDLDELSLDQTRIDAINAIKQATDITLKDVRVPMDSLLSQRQLFRSLCSQVHYQACHCPCGEPTAIFAHALLALVESVPQLVSQAVSGGEDELRQQIRFMTPVFQKVVAGKLFDGCRYHNNCCQSAQTHLTMAFFIVALESYATQCDLYDLGLVPYLVKGLRSKDLNCKTSALRLVWLALAAKIEPKDVETAYVHGLTVQAAPGSDKGMMEGLLDSGFVAIEEMMRQQRADITLAEVSVITQLATSAVLWPSTKPALLDRRLPWKLFSQLLVEILRLPIINTAPFNEDRLILPTKGCLQLDDLIPDAMCLLSALTGTFLNAMRLQGKEPEHFKDYILPLVMTTLQKHYQQPWGGILVMLLASFMGQLGRGVILKLKKEVPQESFQDAVWTGLNTDVMTRLLGTSDTDTRKNNKQMRGLCYAVLCNGYRPSAAQTRAIDTLLVAWHLTEAWLPGRVGHKVKLEMMQDWLNRNILEHPWLEHMHKHWCQQQFVYDKEAPMPKPAGSEPPKEAPAAPKPVSPAPKSAKSSVTRAKPVVPDALTLSADGILSYHDVADNEDVVVDRAVLQAVEDNSARNVDNQTFKHQLKVDKPLIEEQCKVVHKLFDAFVRHLTELKWNIFNGTPNTPVILASFWASSGFEAISETIATVILQARARGFTAIENGEISILAAFQNKILEQKVMVGKVIDTCQSRLLSWSLSSSQLIQTAKESSAPLRTCPNHPNGCPVPGAAAQQQPASPAAIQAQPQATNNAAVQAQPPASSAAVVQAQPQVTAATAAAANGRAASRQVAQPVTSTAAAEATRTEHLQARDNKQKQLDAQYHALQAQQAAQEAAAHQGQTGNRPGAASSSNDSGAIELENFETLLPMYGPLVGQLQSLHEGDQVQLVRKIAGKKHAMSALQITIPRGHDMVNRISQTKLNKAAHHPQLGESMTQLALAYSLFVSSLTEVKPDSQLYYATDSFRSLSGSQKQGMHDLLVQLKEALPLTPSVAEANASIGVPAAGASTTGTDAQQRGPASPTQADQQVADADAAANEHKPAKKPGAKERKKVAAMKAQQGNADAETTTAPATDKLANKQRQAATAEVETPSTIAAHRPTSAGVVRDQAQVPTKQSAADDKGKKPMQHKAAIQPDAKPAKLQAAAPTATAAADHEATAAPETADSEAQSIASTSDVGQLAEPDNNAGEEWTVLTGKRNKRAAAAAVDKPSATVPDADHAITGNEVPDTAGSSDGSPGPQPGLHQKPSRKQRKQQKDLEKQQAAPQQAVQATAELPHITAAPLAAVPEQGAPLDEADVELAASILNGHMPVIPPTRLGAPERIARRSTGDWQPEAKEIILSRPKPGQGLPKGTNKPIKRMPADAAALDLLENPVLKKILPGKPQPRKKRAIAEAKSANADAVEAGEEQGRKRMTDAEIEKELDSNYTCPITQDLFVDPVTAADDWTYERAAIRDWLKKAATSPMTNLPLAHTQLVPNTKIKAALQELLKQLSPERQAGYMTSSELV